MSKLNDLQKTRKNAAIDARKLLDSVTPDDWGAVEQEKYDSLVADLGRIDAAIDREQAVLQAEAAEFATVSNAATVGGISEDEATANRESEKTIFNAFLRGGVENLTAEQRRFVENRRHKNALTSDTNEAGGYLVPTDFATRLLEEVKTFGNMREVATVQPTSTGANAEWPTVDNTDQEGEIVGENTEVTDEDPAFGLKTIGAYKYSSKGVPVPFELLQDSAIDLESYIVSLLAKRIARVSNRHFTIGTGVSQPKGIIPSAQIGHTAASKTGLVYDDLISLEHSLDLGYRLGARFMLSDAAVKTLKFLKDSEGRPIWVPGIAVGEPDTILGYQFTVNEFMDAPGASKKPIIFGQLSNYMIRDVMGATLFRMTDSTYTRRGQVGFLAFSRHDGALMDVSGASVKCLQNANK